MSMPPDLIPLLLLAVAALIVVFLRSWRRSHRELSCYRCGYPREGLDEALPCPECGAAGPWGMERRSDTRLRLIRRTVAYSLTVLALSMLARPFIARDFPVLREFHSTGGVAVPTSGEPIVIEASGSSRRWGGQRTPEDFTAFPTPDRVHFTLPGTNAAELVVDRSIGMPTTATVGGVRTPYSIAAARAWVASLPLELSDLQAAGVAMRIDLLSRHPWGGRDFDREADEEAPGHAVAFLKSSSGRDLSYRWYKWGGWGLFLLVLFGGNWLIWRMTARGAIHASSVTMPHTP